MANNEVFPRSLKVLEAGMENAFRSGDLGGAALLAWEILAVFPDQGFSARIYVKKLLRDPYITGIDLETFRGNVAELAQTGDAEELARLAALIPPPRQHRTRYHGVLAPHARLRAAVVSTAGPGEALAAQLREAATRMGLDEEPAPPLPEATRAERYGSERRSGARGPEEDLML